MRTLSAAELAALQRSPLPLAILVEMDLASGNLYLNTGNFDLTLSGTTYYGTKGLGKIDPIQDSPSEIRPLKFTLSAAPSASISLALTEPVQGKAARIKLALFDPDTYQVFQARLRWSGRLDVMAIDDGQPLATLQVSAEHAAIDLLRTTPVLYSDSDQRRLYSNDPSLQYVADQLDMRIIWPAASWRP
jgi:hypothetical protein